MADYKGFDCETNVEELAPRMAALGYDFFAGYYSSNARKVVTLGEIQALSANGVKFVAVYEDGNSLDTFTKDNGKRHADVALNIAQTHGQPPGGIIYFAIDTDITNEYLDAVLEYLAEVNTELGSYKVGVYGNGLVCSTALEQQIVAATWVSGSGGWTGSHDFKNGNKWNINQHPTTMEESLGIEVDLDDAQGVYGGFLVTVSETPTPAIDQITLSLGSSGPTVRQLQQLLVTRNCLNENAVDGIFGNETKTAVQRFQNTAGLVPDGVVGPQTWSKLLS